MKSFKPFQKTKAIPSLMAVTIYELKRAKRESAYKKMSDKIMEKFGVAVSFEGDSTSGLVMSWDSRKVSEQVAEQCATYAWQQFVGN